MYNRFMEPHLPKNVLLALRKLQADLRKIYHEQAPMLLLYGSYARGEAQDASDVDVLLIYPSEVLAGQEIERLTGVLADLNLRYQVLISITPTSEKSFRHLTGAFWNNIRREGVMIGKD